MSEPEILYDPSKPVGSGAIRIRSNVCTSSKDWHLVPGDLINSSALSHHNLTTKQQEERMYYERCSYCHRTIYEIEENGCDDEYSNCRAQGIMSTDQAKRRRENLKAEDGVIT